MDRYKYYEVVMAEQTDDEPNMLVVCVRSTVKPTKNEMEKLLASRMKKYGCDHVDSIQEIDSETAYKDFNIKTEEDFIVYK